MITLNLSYLIIKYSSYSVYLNILVDLSIYQSRWPVGQKLISDTDSKHDRHRIFFAGVAFPLVHWGTINCTCTWNHTHMAHAGGLWCNNQTHTRARSHTHTLTHSSSGRLGSGVKGQLHVDTAGALCIYLQWLIYPGLWCQLQLLHPLHLERWSERERGANGGDQYKTGSSFFLSGDHFRAAAQNWIKAEVFPRLLCPCPDVTDSHINKRFSAESNKSPPLWSLCQASSFVTTQQQTGRAATMSRLINLLIDGQIIHNY